ncbi:MAG: hypothetical protein CMJ39_06345 [Phycisphaerae bacterium]|nr:hypothetical protein [Phycisphaerae bacterium]|tara:strand:+ start:111 stop:485 length:375 start_codon:yes stop_codon:yes gene_type:complete
MDLALILLLIFAGGATGAIARFHLVRALEMQVRFPAWFGIMCVNIIGCLGIGILAAVLGKDHPAASALLLTGLLGGFTTFSTAMLDAWILRLNCSLGGFFLVLFGTPLFGIPAAAFGLWIGGGA